MSSSTYENILGKYLYFGSATITVFVLINTVTDPVNVTKLFVLGGLAGALFPLVVLGSKTLITKFLFQAIAIAAFLLFSLISILKSSAPFNQGWFGVYGRNTGFVTYLFLSIVFLASLLISKKENFSKFIYSFLTAGLINVIYCLWVLLFGDFIGWNNEYGNILGLFGNPNFISSFLGMFIVAATAQSLQFKNYKIIILNILISTVAFYEVIRTHSIQGIVVTFGGLAIVCFYFLRSKLSNFVVVIYSSVIMLIGILAILGTLQKGPLDFIYKKSVSLRGSYWRAGLNMGIDNPIFGVGMDNYGDWYRRARPPVALVDTPAVHVITNASHNVVIDFFAFGGLSLLTTYLLFIGFGMVAIYRTMKISKKYDPIFVTLASVWICYQVQSLISINQIGLAIWGWTLTGLLIAYERYLNISRSSENKKTKMDKRTHEIFSPALLAMIGALIGLLLSWPPLNSDAKFYNAMKSKRAEVLEEALIPSVVNPASSFKYSQAVDLFMRSNLLEPALKYARIATQFNPDSFDSWRQLYYLENSTENEKVLALQNMKRLDPKNTNVLALP